MAQTLINGSVAGTKYTSKELANLLGMEKTQLNGLYLLYISEHGDTGSWKISVQQLLDFVVSDVLTNEALSGQFDAASTDQMKTAKTIVDAVVSEKAYTAKELSAMMAGLSEQLDENTMELLYLYHASAKNSDPNWELSMEQLFKHLSEDMANDPRFSSLLDDDFRGEIQSLKQDMDERIKQLKGSNHSRMILTTTLPVESDETKAFFEKLTATLDEKLKGDYYLVGNSAMGYEVGDSFSSEMLFITLLSAVAIFLVVALTFRSLIIPAILVSIVQCAIFIIFSILGFQGAATYYLALLVVQCILMGATIDYGILFTNYYRENRRSLGVKEALIAAYNGSIHTIATSGLIMVLMTAVVGAFFPDPTLQQICLTLSQGCLCAILLILIVLPGMLTVFDRFMVKNKGEVNRD